MSSTFFPSSLGESKLTRFSLRYRLTEDLLLDGSASDYEYLNKSAQAIDGVNDLEEWKLLTVS